MYKNAWKWNFVILFAIVSSILWSTKSEALDDFDIIRYGPDVKVEIGRTDFIVKFKAYKDNDELNREYQKETGDRESAIAGYSLSHPSYDVCEVHMVMPKIWDDHEALTILGHEVLHCTLADHADEEGNDIADSILGTTPLYQVPMNQDLLTDEELLAEDRKLELEWLREDYEKMGIVVDE
jgi:hypothetical protein